MNPEQIKAYKSLFRCSVSSRISSLGKHEKQIRSLRIIAELVRKPYYRLAKNIMVYLSLDSEVGTKEFIRGALQNGKRVFAPKLCLPTRQMAALEVKSVGRGLSPGAYGVWEPSGDFRNALKPSLIDLVIVPGLAFDYDGGRLGRGAGYYDRFLRLAGRSRKVGLAFREQILDRIPLEAHDIRMDEVITA